nr:unnamed protein product [Spirometra erinaceieuropaei]
MIGNETGLAHDRHKEYLSSWALFGQRAPSLVTPLRTLPSAPRFDPGWLGWYQLPCLEDAVSMLQCHPWAT